MLCLSTGKTENTNREWSLKRNDGEDVHCTWFMFAVDVTVWL